MATGSESGMATDRCSLFAAPAFKARWVRDENDGAVLVRKSHDQFARTFNTMLATHDLLLRAERRGKLSASPAAARLHLVPFYSICDREDWRGPPRGKSRARVATLPIDINALAPGAVNTRMTRKCSPPDQLSWAPTNIKRPSSKRRTAAHLGQSRRSHGFSPLAGIGRNLRPADQRSLGSVSLLAGAPRKIAEVRHLHTSPDRAAGSRSGMEMSELRITVVGLWHLGAVTAACSAKHFDVTGLDSIPREWRIYSKAARRSSNRD